MMGWIGRKLWPWIISAALVAVVVFMGKRNGALSERVKQSERKSDAQSKMRKAAASTRTDRGSVVKRLRDGGF